MDSFLGVVEFSYLDRNLLLPELIEARDIDRCPGLIIHQPEVSLVQEERS